MRHRLTRAGSTALTMLVFCFLLVSAVNYRPLAAVAVVAVLLVVWLARSLILRQPTLTVVLLASYGYWLLSAVVFARTPVSDFLSYDFFRWDGRVFFYYIPFLFFASLRFDAKQIWRFTAFVASFGAAIIVFAVVQRVLHLPTFGLPKMIRYEYDENSRYPFLFGLHRTHNAAGTYFGILALVSVILAGSWPSMPRRRLYIVVSGILVVGLVLTLSREAFLAFIVALASWFVTQRRPSLRRVALFACAIAAVVGLASVLNRPFLDRWLALGPSHHNIATRLSQQGPSIRYFRTSPVLGIGFGRWNDVWDRGLHHSLGTGEPGLVWFATDYPVVSTDSFPHNSYLLFAAELGVVGLTLILLFWFLFIRLVHRALRGAREATFEHAYLAAARACAIFVIVDALFGHGMGLPALGIIVSFFMGTSLSFVPELDYVGHRRFMLTRVRGIIAGPRRALRQRQPSPER